MKYARSINVFKPKLEFMIKTLTTRKLTSTQSLLITKHFPPPETKNTHYLPPETKNKHYLPVETKNTHYLPVEIENTHYLPAESMNIIPRRYNNSLRLFAAIGQSMKSHWSSNLRCEMSLGMFTALCIRRLPQTYSRIIRAIFSPFKIVVML